MSRPKKYALLPIILFLSISVMAQDRLRFGTDTEPHASRAITVADHWTTTCEATAVETPAPMVRRSVYGVLALNPEGRLRSSTATNFFSSSGGTTESVKEKESWMPTMHVGIGFAAGILDVEALVGGGYILNEDFRAEFAEIMLSPSFRIGDSFRIGPYVSLMHVEDGDWNDESKVTLEGGTGTRAGVALGVGNDSALFTCGAGYVDFAFDATAKDGWDSPRKELDLSGWLFHLGVTFTF